MRTQVVHRCLKNDGIFLLHTIGHSNPDMPGVEPFFHTCESYFLANNLVIKKTSFFKLSHNLTDIFPNGFIPYHQDITKYTEGLYTLEDWHNFGHCKNYTQNSKINFFIRKYYFDSNFNPDYNPTLLAWHANFVKNWPKIQHKYGQRFYRMWTCKEDFNY
jgi:cyclopropane-fatty-acyl-phospholipid synthase